MRKTSFKSKVNHGLKVIFCNAPNFLFPGGGTQEARQAGKGVGTQLVYGLGEGAIQAGTEKMFNVGNAFSKMFGKGVADDVVKGFINKATASATGRAFLTAGASAAGEGFEEFVGDILEPILKRATGVDRTARFILGAAAYDAAIGAALGGVGAAPDISAGIRQGRVDRADSAINNAYDAMRENGMFSREARDAAEQARGKFLGTTERPALRVPNLATQSDVAGQKIVPPKRGRQGR